MHILNMISEARNPKPATVVGFEIAGVREREAMRLYISCPTVRLVAVALYATSWRW